jgi:hypothetical protein
MPHTYDRPVNANVYRIVPYGSGFEPQMSYSAGVSKELFWFPLTPEGYWLQPDAFTDGDATWHISMPESDAERAIFKAQVMNSGGLKIVRPEQRSDESH